MTSDDRGGSGETGEDPVDELEVTDEEIKARIAAAAEDANFSDPDLILTEENLREATLRALHLCGLPTPIGLPGDADADQTQHWDVEAAAKKREQDRTDIEIPALVSELRELLGAMLVAYLGGVAQTSEVAAWAEGTDEPPAPVAVRFRLAHGVAARLLARGESYETVQSWFQGQNLGLGDVSPARALREGRDIREADLP